jgi:HEAT repeat protein
MTVQTRSVPAMPRLPDARLVLLFGQCLSLGITLSLMIVTASALFMTDYGSPVLPYVYITVAVLGSVGFFGFAELQRHWPLPRLAITTISCVAAFFFLAWLGLAVTEARWLSFALMVSFTLIVQMGFVLIGGQAGRLLDVREMKRLFPRAVAGFTLGFMVGGFLASYLAGLTSKTENLLLAAVAGTLSLLAFLVVTDRRFRAELTHAGPAQRRQPARSLPQLLTRRFVLLIFFYQMLAAMVGQLLDFVVYDRAAVRFTDSQAFARFFGNFTVAINLTDVLFVVLLAGLFLGLFGLRYGLSVRPVVNGLLLAVGVVAGLLLGPASMLFFSMAIITRIADITLTDGATRGSMNATYQALPSSDRITVLTGVEGIGAPLALGLTGVLLLLFNAIPGLTIIHISLFALVATAVWVGVGLLVYRGYSAELLQTLRRRALRPAELALDDGSSLAVVENLLQSGSLRDVRLALDLLEEAEHDSLDTHLIRLAEHPGAEIRTEALARIERRRVEPALPVVQQRVQVETEPAAKAAALRALGALTEADAVPEILPYLEDADPQVRLGATASLMRYGGIAGILAGGEHLASLQRSTRPADRRFVAQAIGEIESPSFYQPLLSLLADPDFEVRRAALVASSRVVHPRLLPQAVDNLAQPGVRSAAMAALVASGEAMLPLAEEALSVKVDGDRDVTVRLVRACGQVRGERATALLKRHMDHPDREVRYHVLLSLRQCGYQAYAEDRPAIQRQLAGEARLGARVLQAGQYPGAAQALEPLLGALEDEYDRVRQHVFLLLSFVHDAGAILGAERRLAAGDTGEKALALEMLDVTLSGEEKRMVFPLLDPDMPQSKRLEQLGRRFPQPSMDDEQRLQDFITDPEGMWARSWVRACAVYAAGKLGSKGAVDAVEAALDAGEAPLRETAAWALHALDPDRYQIHAAALAADPDPRLARLAAHLEAQQHRP